MYRGGFALLRELTVLTDVTMTIHGDREKFTPFGLSGGLNGGGCNLIINKGTKKEFDAGMYATGVELKKGDKIFYASSGGGGFGNPLERDQPNAGRQCEGHAPLKEKAPAPPLRLRRGSASGRRRRTW